MWMEAILQGDKAMTWTLMYTPLNLGIGGGTQGSRDLSWLYAAF